MTQDRDRTTVRRALRAGGIVGGVLLVAGVAVTASLGAPFRAAAAAAIAGGLFVAAGWLLLATLLDTLAGDPPDRRRTWWTVAMTALAMLGPFLLLSAFVDPTRGAG